MLLCVTELCNECIVWCAEDGHEQVEKHEEHEQQDIIDGDTARLREHEQDNRDERKRYGNGAHERDPAPAAVIAAVRPAGNQRVCDGIKNASDGQYQAEQCEPEENRVLGDIGCKDARIRVLCVRRAGIVVDHPVGDDAGEQTPAELANSKNPQEFVCDFLHGMFLSQLG